MFRDWYDPLALAARGSRPIVIGPWRSELGFEATYFLPWLATWRARHKVAKERLFVITRGGAGHWYDVGHAVELYDYVPLEAVRKAMLADSKNHGSIKQQTISGWERKLLAVITHDLGLRRYHWIHPSQMYNSLSPWWAGTEGSQWILSKLTFSDLPVPAAPLTLPLPEKFVAVRFYARNTWPLNDDLKNWTQTLIERLAAHVPIVLLETGLHADDHVDFPISGDNILSIKDHVTAQNNLAVQSAVIAKSQAFIGTYGGLMQLAIRLKKPAMGFFEKFEGTAYNHKVLTEQLAVMQQTPCYIGDRKQAQFVREIMQVL